jgi:hypothetical protein
MTPADIFLNRRIVRAVRGSERTDFATDIAKKFFEVFGVIKNLPLQLIIFGQACQVRVIKGMVSDFMSLMDKIRETLHQMHPPFMCNFRQEKRHLNTGHRIEQWRQIAELTFTAIVEGKTDCPPVVIPRNRLERAHNGIRGFHGKNIPPIFYKRIDYWPTFSIFMHVSTYLHRLRVPVRPPTEKL